MTAYLNLAFFRPCRCSIHLAPCVSLVSFLLCLEPLTAEQLHFLVATLFCSFGFPKEHHWKEGKNQSSCSVLLLVKKKCPSWRHLPCCLINRSRLVSFLASLLAVTGCASVDSNHVTSSLATNHLSPFYQYAQRCLSAGKLNNVNKRGSASFPALFCSGLIMWRYQMRPRIWLYSGLLLSMLRFMENYVLF